LQFILKFVLCKLFCFWQTRRLLMENSPMPQNSMTKTDDKEQRAVQSIEVGGRLLLALTNSVGPLTLKELAAQANLSPSRAHPYLVSFGKLRLIEQDPVSGQYALGSAALQMGLTVLRQLDPLKAAWPVAQELANSTGHAVALAVWGNLGPTIVRMIEARQPLHVSMRVGSVMSILGTATGRAFAGTLPADRLEQAMKGSFGELTGQPSFQMKLHAKELHEARVEAKKYGVSRAVGRPIPGVNAFSGVVLDHEGEAALVITVLGHHDRLPPEWNSPVAQAVREAALQVSASLGWRPVAPDTGT
jgi:DNA-binding IclR family transcriptional regulator